MRNRSTRLSVNSDSPLVHAADITKSPVSIPQWAIFPSNAARMFAYCISVSV